MLIGFPPVAERTFLAWLRTSLSFASIGVAITQLFRLNTSLSDAEDTSSNSSVHTLRHLGKPLGGVFLGISILILFLGYHRYFQAQQWIIKGKFPASRGTVILVSLVALGLMIVSLYVLRTLFSLESLRCSGDAVTDMNVQSCRALSATWNYMIKSLGPNMQCLWRWVETGKNGMNFGSGSRPDRMRASGAVLFCLEQKHSIGVVGILLSIMFLGSCIASDHT